VGGVDGNPPGFFLRSSINFIIFFGFGVPNSRQGHSNSSGEGSFAVVNVTDRTNVNVGFIPFKFCACHELIFPYFPYLLFTDDP
jgi:hypothetical protein